MRTANDNAAEFGRFTKGGEGWALGLLVACSVHPGEGQGSQPRSDRNKVGKISAQAFARTSGTSATRVLRYFAAWERAAEKNLVDHAADLRPGDGADADRIPTGYDWGEFYDASKETTASIKRHVRTALATPAVLREMLEDDDVRALVTTALNRVEAGRLSRRPAPVALSLDERWDHWGYTQNGLFLQGAALAAETENPDDLSFAAAGAYLIYQRIAERQIDSELRQLLEDAAR